MNTRSKSRIAAALVLLSTLIPQLSTCLAQGTAFTYQGRLNDGASPANGIFDLTFSVWTAGSGPFQIGNAITNPAVAVSNGLFAATLDFGITPFTGEDRWIEIGVRTNGGGGFVTMTPRQKLTATPYAILSGSLSGTLPAGQLSGTLSAATLPTGGEWPLTTTLTLDSSTLAVDPVNNRVGIGTSTPSVPLTVATGVGYGIEHTDGTRRMSTFLDVNGCWLGSVSADKLLFYVNNGGSAMTLDLAGRLGLGTAAPAQKLHLFGPESRLRLQSSDSGSYAVTEYQTDARTWHTGVGGSGTGNGLNGKFYLWDDTAAAVRMAVDASGNVGIGTTAPTEALHVHQAKAKILISSTNNPFGSMLVLSNSTSGSTVGGRIVMQDESTNSIVIEGRGGGVSDLTFILDATYVVEFNPYRVLFRQPLHLFIYDTTLLRVDRLSSDGKLVSFERYSDEKGNISVSGETVSYNAFTGSHYAWTDAAIQRGQLVRMTGDNRRFADDPANEIVYGVTPTASENDPACLGTYLALLEPTQPVASTNPHLVMAVGNGDLWVVDAGSDIEPGDGLISAGVVGCARKDDPARFAVGHVVARAAERVVWSEVAPDSDGVKRQRISVLFGPFVRGDGNASGIARAAIQELSQKLEQKQTEITELKTRLDKLERLLTQANGGAQ